MDDKLVEAVARAMADVGPGESLAWEFYVDEARAAIAVCCAAVIEECARAVEKHYDESSSCDYGGIDAEYYTALLDAAAAIRALKEKPGV